MLPLCTLTPLPLGPVPVTLRWGECMPIQHIFLNDNEQAGERKYVKGAGLRLSTATRTDWRRRTGTSTYPQPINFEGRCEDLKLFLFGCSGGSKTDEYSTLMKEFAEYIGRKFNYGEDIQWSFKNEMKTVVSDLTRMTGTRDYRELSRDQKFV